MTMIPYMLLLSLGIAVLFGLGLYLIIYFAIKNNKDRD